MNHRHLAFLLSLGSALPALGADYPGDLPWSREESLRNAAAGATIEAALEPQCPQPSQGSPSGPAICLSNPQIMASLWGRSDRITLSLLKTDVWDRRCCFPQPVSLAQIREGAFAPSNVGFDDMPANRRRPVAGYLLPKGGRTDPYAGWNAYPFPCQKPVGQIILGMDEFAGAFPPHLIQGCRDGTVRLQANQGDAMADLEILLSMRRNVIAFRGRLSKVYTPWLRLYRHQDQSHRLYLGADGRGIKGGYDYDKDSAWNGPIDPPTSGTDGSFFWIRQRMPAEKTFPGGFDYVMVGLAPQVNLRKIEALTQRKGLGTPPSSGGLAQAEPLEKSYSWIREAPGAAATAYLVPESDGAVTAYVTVVSSAEAPDPLAEAESRLLKASSDGFQKLQEENAEWFGKLYDERESGRVFFSRGGKEASESIEEVFRSWSSPEEGGCLPDPRRYEATGALDCVEQDWQPRHGLPAFDEIYTTSAFLRNRADSEGLWWKLVNQWLPAARDNAREVFGASGMMMARGVLPPVKPDRYVHTDCALEFCVDAPAQAIKPLWNEWDYGGDIAFLRDRVYPALRDLAVFYASYEQRGPDGYFHLIPALEPEAWGIFPGFARGQDSISALCMARWTFLRAAEAAEILHADADLRWQWRSLAGSLAPYPTFFVPSGVVFNSVDGTKPSWSPGDFPWFAGTGPTMLADEITLDSTMALRDQMVRTVAAAPAPNSAETLVLLGACPDTVASSDPSRAAPIADERSLRDEVIRCPERLLNSRGGPIWLFPCVPAWANVAFRNFQARGAFLVSAVKDGGGVQYVEIEARGDQDCRLLNPWPGKAVTIEDRTSGGTVNFREETGHGECLIFSTDPGHVYAINRPE